MDDREAAVDRVNFTDLKGQGAGKMHVLFEDKVVRAKSFYANPEAAVDKRKLRLRTNHFIKVAKPDAEAMENANRMPEIAARLVDPDFGNGLAEEARVALTNLPEAADAKIGRAHV